MRKYGLSLRMIKLTGALALTTALISGCTQLDVVGQTAVTSFTGLINAMPGKVTSTEDNLYWKVQSPAANAFVLSKSSDATETDAAMIIDVKPFLNAGLNVSQLPKEYIFDASSETLTIGANLGKEPYKLKIDAPITDVFGKLVKSYRDSIGYHEILDHYGIALGGGNMIEWAKDLSSNDKDLVFVLNPEPFIQAGTDPSKITEWIFTKVDIIEDGKTKSVDKFLMPFQIQ